MESNLNQFLVNLTPKPFYRGLEALIRLAGFGLTEDVLWKAIQRGFVYRSSRTSNDPTATLGIGVWGETIRGLAEETGRLGWHKRELHLFPSVVHPQGVIRIGVLSGNELTGIGDPIPSNHTPLLDTRGKMTRKAISDNQQFAVGLQGSFFHLQPSWSPPVTPSPLLTYFLVHYIEIFPQTTVRAELSLPVRMDNGLITDWADRIILTPPVGMFSTVPQVPVTSAEEQEADLDVHVEEIEEVS